MLNIDKSHQIRYGLLVIVSGLMAAISLVLTEITIHQYQTAPLLIAILGNALGGVILLLADRWKRPIMKYSWSRRDLGRLAIAALFTYSLSYLFGFLLLCAALFSFIVLFLCFFVYFLVFVFLFFSAVVVVLFCRCVL